MTNSKRLRGVIFSQFSSISALARQLGWGRQKLHRIVSGEQIPDLLEVHELALALHLSLSETAKIFLEGKSPNEQQYREPRHACHREGDRYAY